MRPNLIRLTSSLAAGAAALTIVGAPVVTQVFKSVAAPTRQSCTNSGMGVVCHSPGDNEINDAPPAAGFYPYGGEAFLLGGGAGGAAGGAAGGGFHSGRGLHGGGSHGGGHR